MKLAIWDFDGTLAYREGLWTSALLQVLDAAVPSHEVTVDAIRPHLQTGLPWHAPEVPHRHPNTGDAWWGHVCPVFEAAFIAAGVTTSLAVTLAGNVRKVFCDPSSWTTFPDSIPTLKRLSDLGWTHAILSNHVPELPSIATALGFDPLVATVYTSADLGVEKPHPDTFRRVLDDFPGADAVHMIGDNPDADVRGARAVGIPGILVRRFTSGIEPFCESLDEVVDVLEPPQRRGPP